MTRILAALASLLITAVLTAAVAIPAFPSLADTGRSNGQRACCAALHLGADGGTETLNGRVEAAVDTGARSKLTLA